MKKLLFAIVLMSVLILSACGNEKSEGMMIPDVFGIDYGDAIEVLEAEGFEVKAIETEVASISEKLLYPLEKVTKGSVFKIDNYILDNNGNLTKDYDVFYEGELISDDTSLIIYYAREDYATDTASIESNTEVVNTTVNAEIQISDEEEAAPTAESEKTDNFKETTKVSKTESNKLSSDFMAAMDSYEDFMDEYVAFMKKYMNNPGDTALLMDYTDYMSKYSDFVSDFESWENEELSDAELAYYIEVQTRVNKKLSEVVSQ